MGQYDMLIEALKDRPKYNPEGPTDLWNALASGDIATSVITEISREELVNSLIINVKAVDGNEYEITIARARKWV